MIYDAINKFTILACFSLLLTACSEEKPEIKVAPKPIVWIKTQNAASSQIRRIPGTLQAAEKADLSFRVGGKVDEVLVDLGAAVKRDQVLARLDESTYELTTKSAEGSLQKANAVLIETQNEYRRQSDLFKKGWVSKAALDNAQAALDQARSSVEVSKAELNLTKKDLGYTELLSPYDGKIVARTVEPSQTIQAGQTILQIEGYDGLEVSALVPETIIGNLKQGQFYKTRFPAVPGISLEAKITKIGSRAESANAFPVTLLLQEKNDTLRAGMTAEVDFTFEGRGRTGYSGQVVKIPPTAILPGEDQKSFAFVYDETAGVVRKREIQTENIINNEIMISKGLKPGEIIATAGVAYLHDGQAVRLLGVGTKQFN